jgi:hypothetical protein
MLNTLNQNDVARKDTPAAVGFLGGVPPAPVVTQTAASASAGISYSSKPWAALPTMFESPGGRRVFLHPTCSLATSLYRVLLLCVTDVVCTYAELMTLAKLLGIFQTHLSEDARAAPQLAAFAVRQLREDGLAGEFSTVVTLGRRGVIAADWRTRCPSVWYLAFTLRTNQALLAPPDAAGAFLEAYIAYSHWAVSGVVKEPVRAAAIRSMRFVARQSGLHRDSYDIEAAGVSRE